MNRRKSDTMVGVFLGSVLVAGSVISWQAYERRRAVDQSMGSMMDSSMGTMHGPNPLWYVFGTLLIVGIVGGVYLVARSEIPAAEAPVEQSPSRESPASNENSHTASSDDSQSPEQSGQLDDDGPSTASINAEAQPQARVLDLLPADERRILEPVLDSPGITQIELRDRADFSKSKVSQTVSSLEQRGLLYRESQGRTYRIYPSDDLEQHHSES